MFKALAVTLSPRKKIRPSGADDNLRSATDELESSSALLGSALALQCNTPKPEDAVAGRQNKNIAAMEDKRQQIQRYEGKLRDLDVSAKQAAQWNSPARWDTEEHDRELPWAPDIEFGQLTKLEDDILNSTAVDLSIDTWVNEAHTVDEDVDDIPGAPSEDPRLVLERTERANYEFIKSVFESKMYLPPRLTWGSPKKVRFVCCCHSRR
jgi:hypothetical protein